MATSSELYNLFLFFFQKWKKSEREVFFQYSEEDLRKAIDEVKIDKKSVNATSKKYGIPRKTLANKVSGKTPIERKMGPSTNLTPSEENRLVEWIIKISRAGFPLVKEDILCTVQRIIVNSQRETNFTENKPGKKWFDLFMKRHRQRLSKRTPETLTNIRASVTENQIRTWFNEVENFLRKENLFQILENASRIFNCDESAFALCPKSGKVIAPRGEKNVYEVAKGSDKESLTVSICVSADGKVLPPFIVLPYKRIPREIVENVPSPEWGIGKSDTGWMNGQTFYEYVANVFNPWLDQNQIQKPVILFLDGHKSHLTMHLSEFCNTNGIIVIALLANSTHTLQPCDVSVFGPLKKNWRKVVHEWKFEHPIDIKLDKATFPKLFNCVLKKLTNDTIKNGFRRCGLCPWDANNVDYSKCIKKNQVLDNTNKIDTQEHKKIKITIDVLESYLEKQLCNEFNETLEKKDTWKGDERYTELFNFWRSMKHKVEVGNLPHITADSGSQKRNTDILNSALNVTENLNDSIPELGTPKSLAEHVTENSNESISELGTAESLAERVTENSNDSIPELGKPESLTEHVVNEAPKSASLFQPSKPLISPENTDYPGMRTPLLKLNDRNGSDSKSIRSPLAEESSNSSVGTPFKRALFWPETSTDQGNKRRKKEKIPTVVTSKEWMKYFKHKDQEKRDKEREKENRKKIREEKKLQKVQEKTNKDEENRKKRKRGKKADSDSDSSTSETEDITYQDSSDGEFVVVESEDEEKSENKKVHLEVEKYYAVFYEEQYFIGRIVNIEDLLVIKFLKEITENNFVWPQKDDVDKVDPKYVFYGPIALRGNEPFSIDNAIHRKIRCCYRQFKSQHRV